MNFSLLFKISEKSLSIHSFIFEGGEKKAIQAIHRSVVVWQATPCLIRDLLDAFWLFIKGTQERR